MGNHSIIKYSAAFCLLLAANIVAAQDTTKGKPRQVQVTSAFKPVLKDAAKINFNASPLVTDTTRPRLQYQIPNQNLLFAFQPGTLKPLALDIDTTGYWENTNYVKIGYGSLKSPFVEAGLSLGDGKTAGINIYARHLSSSGKRDFQDFSNTNVDVHAFFQSSKNLEWNARFGGLQERYNKYGYEPQNLIIPEDSLAVKFQTWRGRIGFHNINRTQYGLSYAPEVKIDVFNDQASNTESNTYVNLPLQKALGETFTVDVAVTASLSLYKPEEKETINNNFLSIAPSILYKKSNLSLQAGIKPSWDNGEFKLFPNAMAEFSSNDKRFSFQLGWIGYLRNAGYQYLAGINPYINAPENVFNTRVEERYAGFKGSAGNHFSYSAKVGSHKYNNQPLFVNDGKNGNSFIVLNEPEMKALHLGGDVGFTVGEKFSIVSGLSLNQFNNLKVHEKAYGLAPLEFKTNIRLQVLKDLYVKGDLYSFSGTWYRTPDGKNERLSGGMDLSAGAEFAVLKNLKVWAQFNNIFNKEYQRWNQYPVYGFNLMGGIVFSFAQNQE